ncbi:class I SAM-dependent DNA methyltransferase [Pontibacter akesuensis]|uniref:site-specific DNA-methyltransferase (adenine-specific) n=1 Tax=Pontibacter akesuensis TaxID=388950 RepID=A0A1I7FL93_9BACT|nr:Eco57I restriction-modification methylase domain-containing protein [Pontibacter akesuensis]GHA61691.1 type II restriction endonuclease [Pontibacter akesuensis]SFU36806.1 Type II restriction/modification system, DNA methylase subunit YeeA [Pontibacter akesuensis]
MQHTVLRPKQALNKAYLRNKTSRTEMEQFKEALSTLLDSIDLTESEEHVKNHLRDFLKGTFYGKHGVNTKGKTDLVIHTGANTKSPAGVLLEVKRPTNKADMPTRESLNCKAMHELVLYYLRERVEHKNNDLKQLAITSVHEWFVFDALEFDRLFYRNGQLRRDFTDWSQGKKSGNSTDFFYKEIAAPYIAKLQESITFTHFNLKDYEKPLRNKDLKDDVKLVALYKLLSPAHLLKESFTNDANSLDPGFYLELLHIIGLEEVKEGGRKLIQRKAKPDGGSLLEAAYQKLKSEDLISGLDNPYSYGSTREEQLFSVALELCITWMNRILFLKLLEAQLASYHHGDKAYVFMRHDNLKEFDDLNELFFDVLAERPENRSANVRHKYSHIPYLNSSLFETTALEKRTLRISNLKDNSRLPLYAKTVLRDVSGKPLIKSQPDMRTLEYLLRFLASYDFGAEGKEEIQEENKTLITASVLGLIFEKINGYRDGSFYTPGFITMYMSREAIRRAVARRFAEKYGWGSGSDKNGLTFESLQLHIHQNYSLENIREYNQLINGIRVCDPAVGSGHYLVSALNELIVIKHELRLLLSRQGKPLHYGGIEVANDELIITDLHGDPFSYTVTDHADGHRTVNPQVQELQEALFHEKQTIIENCLFGVDINPNSVKICRLRLWIELLKNAYYQQQETGNYTQLQTLPNIDINIKQGNSLLSRYPLSADLQEAFGKKGHSLQAYREAVLKYKHTNSKDDKKRLVAFLDEIKQGFRTSLSNRDPLRKALSKIRGELAMLDNNIDLFGNKFKKEEDRVWEKKRLVKLLEQKEKEVEDIEANAMFQNAFEWRFEFPEVLDEQGSFTGFDVVIGNPPYIRQEELGSFKVYLKKAYSTFAGTADLYVYFVERGIELLREGGQFSYILPNKWMRAGYGQSLRTWLQNHTLVQLLDFGDLPVFEEATTYPLILAVAKYKPEAGYTFEAATINTLKYEQGMEAYVQQHKYEVQADLLPDSGWTLSDSTAQQLLEKLKNTGTPLGEYVEGKIYRGVLTGLNEAFVIDEATKDRLIAEDSRSAEIIKPFLAGRDVKRYQPPKSDKHLILFPAGFTKSKIGNANEQKAWEWIQQNYTAVARFLAPFADKARKRADKGNYWWELRACAYYDEFEKPKILFQEIATFNAFAWDVSGAYSNNKTFIVPDADLYLLGLLNSKVVWYFINQIASKLQGGALAMQTPYTFQIPIVSDDEESKVSITQLVEQILSIKQADAAADTSKLEAKIDVLVYRLYHLTYEEVLLVDPGFALSRDQYEFAPAFVAKV